FVGAFVTPEHLSVARVDRAHAVWTTLDDIAVFDLRELSASAHVKHVTNENHLRRSSEIFCFPLRVARLSRDGTHAPVTGNVNEAFCEDRFSFTQGQPVFVDAILLAQAFLARSRVERSDAF